MIYVQYDRNLQFEFIIIITHRSKVEISYSMQPVKVYIHTCVWNVQDIQIQCTNALKAQVVRHKSTFLFLSTTSYTGFTSSQVKLSNQADKCCHWQ